MKIIVNLNKAFRNVSFNKCLVRIFEFMKFVKFRKILLGLPITRIGFFSENFVVIGFFHIRKCFK